MAVSTAMPTTMPAFMSKTPGPWARPPSSRQGISASVPTGQTVSRWPRSSVPPSRNTTEARRASPRDEQGRSSAGTPLSRRVSWTQAASRETRAASPLGLSSRTSASRSLTRRGRSDSKVESQRDVMGDNLSPRTSGGGDGPGKSGPRRAWSTAEPAGARRGGPRGRLPGLRLAAARADQRPGIFRIAPLRPVAELRREALAASPPPEAGPFRPVDLVGAHVSRPHDPAGHPVRHGRQLPLDPGLREARAFLQRPAAEALRAGPPRPRGRRATASSSTTPTGRGG